MVPGVWPLKNYIIFAQEKRKKTSWLHVCPFFLRKKYAPSMAFEQRDGAAKENKPRIGFVCDYNEDVNAGVNSDVHNLSFMTLFRVGLFKSPDDIDSSKIFNLKATPQKKPPFL